MDLSTKAKIVRKWCLISTSEAGSGHPTSCLSAADLMTVLFDQFLTYDLIHPQNLQNDRVVFSKGHVAPLLYALFGLAGGYDIEETKTLRKSGSRFEGHPTPRFPYAEAATGSLGQGLSVGCGLAIGLQREAILDKKPKVYVLLGDGELAEGQVWEAANFASHNALSNLVAIVDVNRLGQSQETMFGHRVEEYTNRFAAFGWDVISIDGHDLAQITDALTKVAERKSEKPIAIIAKTHKGHGISFLQDKEGWHGKPLGKEDLEKALAELGTLPDEKEILAVKKPQKKSIVERPRYEKAGEAAFLVDIPQIGEEVATRDIYGKGLAQMGLANMLIFALDADVKNSTFSQDFKQAHPDRFIECFIAEQNMVGVALGLSRLGKSPFVSTFAAFLTRAFDQIRMARISEANITFVGSHVGVSIGADGSSQMGLEDISMFGALPDTIILQPADAVACAKLLPALLTHNGIDYMRTLRPKTSVLYHETESFEIGGSKVLQSSPEDHVTIAATGITVHEALKAYEILKKEGIMVRIVDCYSIKPVDSKTLIRCSEETKQKFIITVEDHFEHGGFGDLVMAATVESGVHVKKMAVKEIAHSGTQEELLSTAGIDAEHIVKKVKSIL